MTIKSEEGTENDAFEGGKRGETGLGERGKKNPAAQQPLKRVEYKQILIVGGRGKKNGGLKGLISRGGKGRGKGGIQSLTRRVFTAAREGLPIVFCDRGVSAKESAMKVL